MSYVNSVLLFFTPIIELSKLQEENNFCSSVLKVLRNPDNPHNRTHNLFYVIKKDIRYRKVFRDGKSFLLLVVPKVVWLQVITEAHDSVVSGHLEVARTYAKIKDRYFCPGNLESVDVM